MILTKREFDKIQVFNHVTVKVDYLTRDKVGSIIIPFQLPDAKKEFVCHKGIVAKHQVFTKSISGNRIQDVEYEIEIGDTVYFGWEALNAVANDAEDILKIECEDDIYLCIPYKELMLAERGDEKFGLCGWVGGYKPKKEKAYSGQIQLLGEDYEKEVLKAFEGKFFELDGSEHDNERIVVTHAPKSYPVWPEGCGHISSTVVKAGETVCFPEGMLTQLNSSLDGKELFAIPARELVAHG